jgi:hypothetical protein
MNKHAGNFYTQILDDVRALVADTLTGVELIRALNGVHPIEIKNALASAGERYLLEKAFGDLNISTPVLKEICRDDNPVLSFWPFTSDCARQISSIVSAHESVALLGVPTVFGVLRERSTGQTILFDTDDYLFRSKVAAGYIQCDVLSETLSQYENQFDLVVGDPPWYFEEYCSWLKAAVGLTRPGGTIIFVLFPPSIRATSKMERDEIIGLARKLLVDIEFLPAAALYETPSFEQIELIRNGISPVDWRSAQFIIGRVPLDKGRLLASKRNEPSEIWIERRIGCGRIFVKDEPVDIPTFLERAGGRSRFLSSPSRRDQGRRRANVISSRGHGLCCSNPGLLLKMLGDIRDAGDIEDIGSCSDPASALLLEAVANDLWPRFIAVSPYLPDHHDPDRPI